MPPTPPEAKKRLFFEACSMRIKHRKYRQKWPLGGVGLGQGVGAQKTRTPGGNWFFSDFLIIFDVAFFGGEASDAGHIGPHGMRRCLSFSYRGDVPRAADPPRGKKAALI